MNFFKKTKDAIYEGLFGSKKETLISVDVADSKDKSNKIHKEGHLTTTYKVGEITNGAISAFMEYGMSVLLPNGENGFVKKEELSIDYRTHNYSLGDVVKVTVIKFLPHRGLYLSMTRLPIDERIGDVEMKIGDVHTGMVKIKKDYGVFIALQSGVTGLLHENKFKDKERFKNLMKGNLIKVKIIEVNNELNRLQFDLG